jgi:mannonate dehydratase
MLRSISAAGIPDLGYNFKPMGNFRTTSTKGRGGATYSTFDYDEFSRNRPTPHGPPASEGEMWEHITYFIERVIPVAEEVGVRMALHPDDPPIPDPLAGVAQKPLRIDQASFRSL